MGEKSKIEWTDATWNPWRGCTKVSPGCKFCYAERLDKRFGRDFSKVKIASEKQFNAPRHWRDPKMIFVCSMSDFFHEDADKWRSEAWGTILSRQKHIFQILTKRAERIKDNLPMSYDWWKNNWELYKHVWFGVSVEDKEQLWRVEKLLKIPTAVRFLSVEPMLGRIDLTLKNEGMMLSRQPPYVSLDNWNTLQGKCGELKTERLSWVICGGESGPGARPMKLDWARSIRDQCKEAGVPFFMKQMGAVWAKENGSKDRKGGDINDWPEDLRIREMPKYESNRFAS